MTDFSGITEETLAAIRKAQTDGFTVASGLQGFDLSGVVSLVPVNTPFYDRVPRKGAPVGSQAANWKALLNVNDQQPNPFVGLEGGGNYVVNSEMDVLAKYQPVRVSGFVTRDAIDLGRNYEDVKALSVTSTLMQWRILENKGLIGGQAFALPAIGTPTATAATTGGSIAASTAVAVKVAARSGLNYYWGGSGAASSQVSVTTAAGGSTNSVTAQVAAVRGAVAYDWFVGGFYYTTTATNKVTITSVPNANSSVQPALPSLSHTLPTSVPSVDASFSANSYNGLIASLAGDYSDTGALITPGGAGTPSGAQIISLDGGTFTANGQGIVEIDEMLLAIYNSAQLSPDRMILGGNLSSAISDAVLATNLAVTYLQPENGRSGQTAGGSVARYINKAAGGQSVDIEVDPHFPAGTVAFVTDRVPYPNSGIANTLEARTLRDVSQVDYGATLTPGGASSGPRDIWDVSSIETFVNRAPVTMGLLENVAS